MAKLLLAAVAVLALVAAASATMGCDTRVDSSSPMVGAKWSSSFTLNTQETVWRTKGDLTKLNLYYDQNQGCVRGVKPTYGYDAANAVRLGTEQGTDGAYFSGDLKLTAAEYFVKAEYKYNSSCIQYLKLTTNKNRQLTIGNSQSSSPLQSSAPSAPNSATSTLFLGFFKGYTDVPNTSAKAGKLQQLQLVWAIRTCPLPSPSPTPVQPSPTPIQPSPTPVQPSPSPVIPPKASPSPKPVVPSPSPIQPPPSPIQPSPSPVVPPAPVPVPSPSPVVVEGPSPSPVPVPSPTPVGCKPSAKMGCNNGRCPLDTCALSGLGLDVAMACYGVNVPLLDLTIVNPCANLACKLDKPNCASAGVMGVGTFCTGTIVAVNAAAKLNPIGKKLVGYPCIEKTGPVLDILPVISNVAGGQGVYMSKAWKACNCMHTWLGLKTENVSIFDSFTMQLPALSIPDGLTQIYSSLFSKPVVDCTLPDAVAQWVAGVAAKFHLPKHVLPEPKIIALKALLPSLTLPALLVPKVSSALLKLPASLPGLPVVTIAEDKLAAVAALLPGLSTLSTLVVSQQQPTVAGLPDLADLVLGNVSISGLVTLAESLKLPTLPSLAPTVSSTTPVPVFNMTLPDVLAEWAASNALKLPLPKLVVSPIKVSGLQALIPGFSVPSLIVPNVSMVLFLKPKNLSVPVFVIPPGTLRSVSLLLPNLTSLATLVTKADLPSLPALKVPNITSLATLQSVAASLNKLSSWSITIKLPALPSMALPDAVKQWLGAVTANMPLPKLVVGDMKVVALKALIPGFSVPSLIVPNISVPLLQLPASVSLPVFVIPNNTLSAVAQLLPSLSSLATLVAKPAQLNLLPDLALPSITSVSTLQGLAASLAIPGLPAIPDLASLAQVNVTELAGFADFVKAGASSLLGQDAGTMLGSAFDTFQGLFGTAQPAASIVAGDIEDAAAARKMAAPAEDGEEAAGDASTGYLSPAEWDAMSVDEQAALLAIMARI